MDHILHDFNTHGAEALRHLDSDLGADQVDVFIARHESIDEIEIEHTPEEGLQ